MNEQNHTFHKTVLLVGYRRFLLEERYIVTVYFFFLLFKVSLLTIEKVIDRYFPLIRLKLGL